MQTLRKEHNQILDFIKDSVFVSSDKVFFLHFLHKPQSFYASKVYVQKTVGYEIENKKYF